MLYQQGKGKISYFQDLSHGLDFLLRKICTHREISPQLYLSCNILRTWYLNIIYPQQYHWKLWGNFPLLEKDLDSDNQEKLWNLNAKNKKFSQNKSDR